MQKGLWIILFSSVFSFSCQKQLDDALSSKLDAADMAQTVGDLMASIDESGGSTGSLAYMNSEMKMIARLAPGATEKVTLLSLIVPSAEAATCATVPGFGSCTNNVITRNFNGCTIGSATVSGTVTLTFLDGTTDNTCSIGSAGNKIYRAPNFEITTSSGAKLAVVKTGSYGQIMTKAASGQVYNVENDGVNRKLTFNGTTIMDMTTTISSTDKLVVTGTSRTGRTLTSGKITITNNLTGKICTLQPSNIQWGSSCNCPTSGSWSGTCDSGTSASLTITGCGTATATLNGSSKSVDFDRCY